MPKEYNKKLQHLWEDVSQNENDIEDIKLRRIELDTYTVTKSSQTVRVLERFSMLPYIPTNALNGLEVVIPFENMPSWGLSGVHIIPIFYSESVLIDPVIFGNPPMYPLLQGSNRFSYEIVPRWQYLDGQYILKIRLRGWFKDITNAITYPLYLDLDILVENPRKYSSQQGYKS